MLKFNLDKSNCSGCSACYSICPVRCITMCPDEEGFLYPEASEACTGCRLCEKVCPLNNEKKKEEFPKRAYAAVTRDYEVWHRSTSGGAFSEIVRHWADTETLIVGAVWSGVKVRHMGVVGFESIAPLCKSKYVSSAMEDSFIEIRKTLRGGKKVVFCGCPCQVDGLRQFLMKPYENLLTIDLICHGQGSLAVFRESLSLIGSRLGEEVVSYEFRTKRKVIEEEYMSKVVTKSRTYYLTNDPYIQLFLSQDILRPSCGSHCQYRDGVRPGDLTIADCRGVTDIFPDLLGSKQNWSTIVCNTSKGYMVAESLHKTMEIREYSLGDVIRYNPLFAHQTWASEGRDAFFEDFVRNPSQAITSRTTDFRIVRTDIKKFLKMYLPVSGIRLLIRVVRHLRKR